MSSIDKLSELFAKFPGIGPRQAKRFVYFLLTKNGEYSNELAKTIQDLKSEINQCNKCMRFFPFTNSTQASCLICSDDTRDSSMLMIVPRDIDFESVEKSGGFNGFYFVLGGVVPVLDKEPEKRIRIQELESRIKSDKNIKELILAMNANIDGENTAEYLKNRLKDFKLKTSILGRGLSTGAELEYADPETLKNAFLHRTS